jgi:hypothetical protein
LSIRDHFSLDFQLRTLAASLQTFNFMRAAAATMLRLQRFVPIAPPPSAFHRRLHSSNQQTRGVRLTWAKMQVFHACTSFTARLQ